MNLIIPDGCEGTLILDRNGSFLYIRLQKDHDEKRTTALVLQISDTRMGSLLLDNDARIKAAGTHGGPCSPVGEVTNLTRLAGAGQYSTLFWRM